MIQAPSTQSKILSLLKKHQQLSVGELKKQLAITDMAVRKHINKLESEQLIQSNIAKKPMGRPVTLYSLSEKGENSFPRNYGAMTVEFLRDIEEINGKEMVDHLFEKREERLLQSYHQRITDQPSLYDQVKELTNIQNENGYMAEVQETDGETIEFIEYNCPIFQVAEQYNKACQCELSLFKRALGTDHIERVSCMSSGDHACKYIIKKTDLSAR